MNNSNEVISVHTQSLFYSSDMRLHLSELRSKSRLDVFSQAFEFVQGLWYGGGIILDLQQDGKKPYTTTGPCRLEHTQPPA